MLLQLTKGVWCFSSVQSLSSHTVDHHTSETGFPIKGTLCCAWFKIRAVSLSPHSHTNVLTTNLQPQLDLFWVFQWLFCFMWHLQLEGDRTWAHPSNPEPGAWGTRSYVPCVWEPSQWGRNWIHQTFSFLSKNQTQEHCFFQKTQLFASPSVKCSIFFSSQQVFCRAKVNY